LPRAEILKEEREMITGAIKHAVMVKIGYGNETKMIPLDEVEIDGVTLKDILEAKDNKLAEVNSKFNEEIKKLKEQNASQDLSIKELQEKVTQLAIETIKQIEASKEVIRGLITR
jgi:glycerol-3-phosphate cytidylyltransferase-like family protein